MLKKNTFANNKKSLILKSGHLILKTTFYTGSHCQLSASKLLHKILLSLDKALLDSKYLMLMASTTDKNK